MVLLWYFSASPSTGFRNVISILKTDQHNYQMGVAHDGWMGGVKHVMFSTAFSGSSLAFKYFLKMSNICVLRTWNHLIRPTRLESCWIQNIKNTSQINLTNNTSFTSIILHTLVQLYLRGPLWYPVSGPPCWPWERGNRNPAPQTSVAVTTGQWGRNLPSSDPPRIILWVNNNLELPSRLAYDVKY